MSVSVQPAHLTYMTTNLSFNTDDHSCLLLEGHHISNIQYSRRHKNVMNVMWRSCESLGWTQCHWPGQNPETRCDMLIHTRESIFIHVNTELVTIRNILVRLLE